MTATDTPLLSYLRQATQAEHRRLERQPLLQPLLEPALDQRHYAMVLAAFHGYYRALEPRLLTRLEDPFAGQDIHYHYLPRAGLLYLDLLDLKVAESGSAGHRLPMPTLATPDHVLGTLYVLEGATQGGRVIAPRVSRALNLGPLHGARYFHLHLHEQWQHFRTLAERRQPNHDHERVAAGAIETFSTLRAHLDAWSTDSTRSIRP
ncbi:MAG: biliverdin-producing heme oxygenase [Aquisalimonadaceae bacterium]